jgi:hypothetical protein
MVRVFLTLVLPLFLPMALYLLWIGTFGSTQEDGVLPWSAMPWIWLASAGVALLAIVLFVVTVDFGSPQEGVYVPPRWEDGRIVPGHIESGHIEPGHIEPEPGR